MHRRCAVVVNDQISQSQESEYPPAIDHYFAYFESFLADDVEFAAQTPHPHKAHAQ